MLLANATGHRLEVDTMRSLEAADADPVLLSMVPAAQRHDVPDALTGRQLAPGPRVPTGVHMCRLGEPAASLHRARQAAHVLRELAELPFTLGLGSFLVSGLDSDASHSLAAS